MSKFFLAFILYVSNYFSLNVWTIQTNWGGKFHSLLKLLNHVESNIASPVPILMSKMGLLKDVTGILWKLASLSYLMLQCLLNIGLKLFKLQFFKSTERPLQS